MAVLGLVSSSRSTRRGVLRHGFFRIWPQLMLRVLVVANKGWEADALTAVFRNPKATPPAFLAGECGSASRNRLIVQVGAILVIVGCIQDLMDPSQSPSSTAEKVRVLPRLLSQPADLVIAFGTGAFLDEDTHNADVVVGMNCFMHNPYAHAPNPKSDWPGVNLDNVVSSSVVPTIFEAIREKPTVEEIRIRLLPCPVNSAFSPQVMAQHENTALSVINVTDYAQYAKVDAEAIKAFEAVSALPLGSIETTHAVIRSQCTSRFVFVTGIANREGHFSTEAGLRDYGQGFVAAHNAAVTLAWLLSSLSEKEDLK